MSLWDQFRDDDLRDLWAGIDSAYWYPNGVLRDLLDETIRRGLTDPEATFVKRLLRETVRDTA